jgi:hypothetical protein
MKKVIQWANGANRIPVRTRRITLALHNNGGRKGIMCGMKRNIHGAEMATAAKLACRIRNMMWVS